MLEFAQQMRYLEQCINGWETHPTRADAYVNGLYALQFVEGQLIGGRDAYADDYEDSPYSGGYSAMGM